MPSKNHFFRVWLVIQSKGHQIWVSVVEILLQNFLGSAEFTVLKFLTELDYVNVQIVLVKFY